MDKGFNRAVTLSANVLNTSTIHFIYVWEGVKRIPKQVTSQKLLLKFIRTGFVCMCCRFKHCIDPVFRTYNNGKTDGNK